MASTRSHHEHFDTVSVKANGQPRPRPLPAGPCGAPAGGRVNIGRVRFTLLFLCVACAPATAHVQTPGSRVFIFIYTASAAEPGRASAPCPRSLALWALALRSHLLSRRRATRARILRPTRRRAGAARLAPSHRHAAARLSHNTTRPYRAPRQCRPALKPCTHGRTHTHTHTHAARAAAAPTHAHARLPRGTDHFHERLAASHDWC